MTCQRQATVLVDAAVKLLAASTVLIGILLNGGNLLREELKKLNLERRSFKGIFERFGLKSGYKGPVKTVLLKDVIDVKTGKVVTDHLWFNLTKGFDKLQLQSGDVVTFDARVAPYTKGYRGRRDDDDLPGVTVDYHLCFPTNTRKVEKVGTDMSNIHVIHTCQTSSITSPSQATPLFLPGSHDTKVRKIVEDINSQQAAGVPPEEIKKRLLSHINKPFKPEETNVEVGKKWSRETTLTEFFKTTDGSC